MVGCVEERTRHWEMGMRQREARTSTAENVINVLIVEDDDAFAELLATCLRLRPGFHLEGRARSIADWTVMAPQIAVDVVVTDYWLPDGTGADLSRTLRELPVRPAVIVMTADFGQEVVRDSAAAGALTVLNKIDGPSRIVETIRRLADQAPFC
jgi:DNA-binding NarL/FixJ family response regulator